MTINVAPIVFHIFHIILVLKSLQLRFYMQFAASRTEYTSPLLVLVYGSLTLDTKESHEAFPAPFSGPIYQIQERQQADREKVGIV